MNGIPDSIRDESVRQVNRSCVIAIHLVLAVCTVCTLIGFTGVWAVSPAWMYYYFATIVLPLLAIAVYVKKRDYRGGRIKYLMVLAASLIPASLAVPTLMGFFLMPLPIVVAGRYFSRRFVWLVYWATLALVLVMMIPHAWFGMPSFPLCEEARGGLQAYLDGRFAPFRYLHYLVVYCFPSYAVCLSFFAFSMSSLCTNHLAMLERQAQISARLADMEKGLVLAAAAQITSSFRPSSDAAGPSPAGRGALDEARRQGDRPQPDVANWSAQAIATCIAEVKRRAAEDPAFAELVERDPAAAVREVQA